MGGGGFSQSYLIIFASTIFKHKTLVIGEIKNISTIHTFNFDPGKNLKI
jgi:hypothetical protein